MKVLDFFPYSSSRYRCILHAVKCKLKGTSPRRFLTCRNNDFRNTSGTHGSFKGWSKSRVIFSKCEYHLCVLADTRKELLVFGADLNKERISTQGDILAVLFSSVSTNFVAGTPGRNGGEPAQEGLV